MKTPRSRQRRRTYLPISVCLCLLTAAAAAAASTLSVTPVRVVVPPGHDTTSLTLTNAGRRPETFQIRAFLWTQGQSGPQLTPTTRVQFSPPMGTLAGGASQIVRLMVPRPAARKEGSYRLFIDQLPPPTAIGGVTMVLRLSIPVFVEPSGKASASVRWRLHRRQGLLWLTAINAGRRHILIRELRLRGTGCTIGGVHGGAFAYLLADSIRRWPVRCPNAAAHNIRSLHLSMQTPSGTATVQLPISAPKR